MSSSDNPFFSRQISDLNLLPEVNPVHNSEADSDSDSDICDGCGGTGITFTTEPLSTFDKTAFSRCPTCPMIRGILQKYASDFDKDTNVSVARSSGVEELFIGSHDPRFPEPMTISIYGHDDPSSIWLSWKESNSEVANAKPPTDIVGDTGSNAAMALAKNWIANCERDHSNCQHQNPSLLPKRIVDLGGLSSNSKIRLYETSNEPAKYVCLSHSWGGAELPQTTKDTLESRKQEISFSELPKTFQDAVIVTRALGVRYIWIDSLCIIQDDASDWRREASRMHSIYRDGYLTIAASKCHGPDGGLFSVAGSNSKLSDWHIDSQDTVIRTRQKIRHFESSAEYPLLQRGWVFQERILSRRVLHFGPKELMWECMEEQACECTLFESSLALDKGLGPKGIYRPVNKEEEGASAWLSFVWWKVVKDYSRTDLTFEKDIFPALSGIAQVHREARGSRYLAGLWEDSLVCDLLWYLPQDYKWPGKNNRVVLQPRPQKWRAPTWSWASVKSAIHYELYDSFAPTFSIEEVETKSVGLDDAGELEDAHLVMSGVTLSVTIHGLPRINPDSDLNFKTKHGDDIPHIFFYEDYDLSHPSTHQVVNGETLRFLHLGKMCGLYGKNDSEDQIWFMVLRQRGRNQDELQRIGVAMMKAEKAQPLLPLLGLYVCKARITIF